MPNQLTELEIRMAKATAKNFLIALVVGITAIIILIP